MQKAETRVSSNIAGFLVSVLVLGTRREAAQSKGDGKRARS